VIYSVWNQGRRGYDYYETSEPARANAPMPRHVGGGSSLGIVPDALAWPLPSDAREIGFGPLARGLIAEKKDGFALGAVPGGNVGFVVALVGGFFLLTRIVGPNTPRRRGR
jgi:hypothetical protein